MVAGSTRRPSQGHKMGATRVTVAIRNPSDPDRVWEGRLFPVGTGATDCLVPRPHLEAIGLLPEGQRRCGLADAHAYPVCHREERSDVAISLNRTTIPPATRLPRRARNDRLRKVGTHELADGSEIRLDIAGGKIELIGETTWGTIVFGDESAEPLLGVTALESVGVEVDQRNQTLNRLPATRLRGFRVIGS